MLRPPKSSELNTHNANVRFLVKLTKYTNGLETRIEQLEKDAKKSKKQLTNLSQQMAKLSMQLITRTSSLGSRISQLLSKKPKVVAPPEETENKENKK